MKHLFIEAESTADISKSVENSIKFLPKKVGLVTTAQHKHKLKQAQKLLKQHNITAVIAGQILGCNTNNAKKIKNKVDAFLYIGSGEFHPIEIALETDKKVVMANPLTDEARVLNKEEVEKIKKQQQGALLKFLSSNSIGIIVSTKSGQNRLKKAEEIKQKLIKKGKKAYLFIADTIDEREFQNFPFIESWVNTACPRFADGKKGIVNLEAVEEFLKK